MLRRRFRGSKLSADLRLHLRFQTPRSHDDARRLRHDRRTEIAEGVSFRRKENTDLRDHDHRHRRRFLLPVNSSFFPLRYSVRRNRKERNLTRCYKFSENGKKIRCIYCIQKALTFYLQAFLIQFSAALYPGMKKRHGSCEPVALKQILFFVLTTL